MRRIICGIFLLMLVVLTCVGCAETKTFKVTFNSDFHDEFSKFVKEGDKVEKPEPLVYEGYNFVDWYLGDAPYDFDAEVTKNLTINAMWEKVQGEKYTVTFKDFDDVELNKVTVEKGEKVNKPADPTKEGFTFVGWYSDSECKDAYDFDTEVNTDLVLYAKFEATVVTYNVVFKGFNGVTLATFSIEEGETVPAILVPDAPVVDGYEFVGWDKEFVSVTEDLIINALYEVVVSEFTVVLYSDTPLITRKTVLDAVCCLEQSDNNVLKLTRGYVFRTQFLLSCEKIYTENHQYFDEEDFLTAFSFKQVFLGKKL